MSDAIERADVARITVDDLRNKALQIRRDATDLVKETAEEQGVRIAIAGVVVVAAVIGLAYYLGTRKGRADAAVQV